MVDVFEDDHLGAVRRGPFLEQAGDFEEDFAAAVAGLGEALAGEAGGEQVDGGEAGFVDVELADVAFEHGDAGQAVAEGRAGMGVLVDGPGEVEAGLGEAGGEPAHAGEEAARGQSGVAHCGILQALRAVPSRRLVDASPGAGSARVRAQAGRGSTAGSGAERARVRVRGGRGAGAGAVRVRAGGRSTETGRAARIHSAHGFGWDLLQAFGSRGVGALRGLRAGDLLVLHASVGRWAPLR